ncbi:uncharacterized protein BCR38DRAFT_406866 [Pseudomassariella vexata]|uniref:Uncharacterized protein n=1 Tax=Pseudomassariella vexata TaxID=1141098 RepID=A0A1Y2EBR3_9PEZI|nr:uncharacterized protein BCR38DRAFT_406866 [Pseudomassariella vexata]ORY68991.1 hypothetical protein BCR38DRAFT_406866 [Pseudomassariella vexata]
MGCFCSRPTIYKSIRGFEPGFEMKHSDSLCLTPEKSPPSICSSTSWLGSYTSTKHDLKDGHNKKIDVACLNTGYKAKSSLDGPAQNKGRRNKTEITRRPLPVGAILTSYATQMVSLNEHIATNAAPKSDLLKNDCPETATPETISAKNIIPSGAIRESITTDSAVHGKVIPTNATSENAILATVTSKCARPENDIAGRHITKSATSESNSEPPRIPTITLTKEISSSFIPSSPTQSFHTPLSSPSSSIYFSPVNSTLAYSSPVKICPTYSSSGPLSRTSSAPALFSNSLPLAAATFPAKFKFWGPLGDPMLYEPMETGRRKDTVTEFPSPDEAIWTPAHGDKVEQYRKFYRLNNNVYKDLAAYYRAFLENYRKLKEVPTRMGGCIAFFKDHILIICLWIRVAEIEGVLNGRKCVDNAWKTKTTLRSITEKSEVDGLNELVDQLIECVRSGLLIQETLLWVNIAVKSLQRLGMDEKADGLSRAIRCIPGFQLKYYYSCWQNQRAIETVGEVASEWKRGSSCTLGKRRSVAVSILE